MTGRHLTRRHIPGLQLSPLFSIPLPIITIHPETQGEREGSAREAEARTDDTRHPISRGALLREDIRRDEPHGVRGRD